MNFDLGVPSFLAGLITFLAPCTLPLVPGYLAFISGSSLENLSRPGAGSAARKRVFLNGLFYVFGFSLIFIVFGSLAGFLGAALVPFRLWLARIGGLLVIVFGLFMLGAFDLPALSRERQIKIAKKKLGTPINSFLLGSAFAFGWTPCVGPILASVLLLTASSATVLEGAFLLAIFSLGLAVPFLLIAASVGRSQKFLAKIAKYLKPISIVSGLLLVALGLLLITNKMSLLISWGFRFLGFFDYQRIQNWL